MSEKIKILKKYWGFNSFKPLQKEIIESIINGSDTLAILPTGGGKSICFQIPGIALSGITIVISPLIALMEDQVNRLNSKGIDSDLLSSSMSYREIDIILDNACFGTTKFLYTSPERLKSELFLTRFKQMKINLIVVDEAHCISEWGHDFRPSYREISTLKEYQPSAPIIALTASARPHVEEDIIKQLKLKNVNCFKRSLNRNNISYQVIETKNKLTHLTKIIKLNKEDCGIIYCQTRKSAKKVVAHLRNLNINAGLYHAGLTPNDRKYMLEKWMDNSLKFMVATNAFGMGIDKSNVRFVIHYEIPNNLEAYYQETGRAGRDGKECQAIAYWKEEDLDIMQERLIKKYPSLKRIKLIYNAICNFLKVAIGSGNKETYNFDINKFHKTFKIPITEVYYSLRILQLNETINFIENNSQPTRLKIVISNSTLYNFQSNYKNLSNLLTILIRSYPAIFNKYISINESNLSKQLKISEQTLIKKLQILEQYKVIEINYKSSLPKITLLTERIADNLFTIKADIYATRKKIDKTKLESTIEYIKEKNKCRSQKLNNYFDSDSKACNNCDICKK